MTRRLVALLFLALLATPALAFKLVDSHGKTHRLADYKGKWVLVNFWATWCPPCLEEIPDLMSLHDNKKNNLVVLGIAMDYRNPKDVLTFAEQQMISYPIILGDYEMAAQIGPIKGLPTTYLFDPKGQVVAYNVGALSKETVQQYISTKGKKAGR
jgi:thiol-disulfide isomerase/thioredoxin